MATKVKSGNKHIVSIGGSNVGLIQSVDMQDDYAPEAASGVGDIHVQEWVPTMARHTIQVEEMVLDTGSMRAAGVAWQNGDQALQGITFDITVVGKESGGTLRKYTGCSYASGSVQVRKHAIIVASGTFHALDVSGSGA